MAKLVKVVDNNMNVLGEVALHELLYTVDEVESAVKELLGQPADFKREEVIMILKVKNPEKPKKTTTFKKMADALFPKAEAPCNIADLDAKIAELASE